MANRRRTRYTGPARVLAYLRVSTEEQAASGAGIEGQRAALEAECVRRGWTGVRYLVDSGYSAKSLDRPAITEALALLETGQADVLLVSKVDRLSRSVADFAALSADAKRQEWALVALDLPYDPTTASGEMVANLMAVLAQWERRLIGERTRAALQARKAAGVKLGGSARLVPDDVRARIRAERDAGLTYRAIAERLNAEGIPTGRNRGQWYSMSVHQIANG